jgi:hypothetical protein
MLCPFEALGACARALAPEREGGVIGEYELLIAQHPTHLQTVSINEAIVRG